LRVVDVQDQGLAISNANEQLSEREERSPSQFSRIGDLTRGSLRDGVDAAQNREELLESEDIPWQERSRFHQ
jgi:hypothetical protein